MHRTRVSGFSLVELLVAVVIGLIGSIIIFQVYASFEGQKRMATSGGDTATNLTIASNTLERVGRQAGYGINSASHMGCDVVLWKQWASPANTAPGTLTTVKLVPVLIDRTAGTTLTFVSSGTDDVYSVTQLASNMTDSQSNLNPANLYGIDQGDLLIVAEKKDISDAARTNRITCAAMQVRNIATTAPRIEHLFGSYTTVLQPGPPPLYTYYNKTGGLESLTPAQLTNPAAPAAQLFDLPLLNLTTAGIAARFTFTNNAQVINVGVPQTASPFGLRASQFTVNNGQLLENGNPVADGIVFMDAQYGIAGGGPTSTTGTVSYISDMPSVATRDPHVLQDDWFRLRTIRVGLIARVGQYDKDYTSPTTITLWGSDSYANPVTYTVPDRHYRYRKIEMVIPLRNMFWRP